MKKRGVSAWKTEDLLNLRVQVSDNHGLTFAAVTLKAAMCLCNFVAMCLKLFAIALKTVVVPLTIG